MTHYADALQAWSSGDLEQAAILCRRLLADQPNHAQALNLLAGVQYRRGEMAEAIISLQRLVALQPNDALVIMNLGNLHRAQNRLDEALVAYERALLLQPQLADAHYNRAIVLKATGRLDEAQRAYEMTLQLVSDYLPARLNLANLLVETNRPAAAVEHYKVVLTRDPTNAAVIERLGHANFLAGRFADAVTTFRSLPAGTVISALVCHRIGEACRRLGIQEPARAALEEALRLDPNNAETLASLGLLHDSCKRTEQALEIYNQALARGLPQSYFRAERFRCSIQLWERSNMVTDAAFLCRAVHIDEPLIDPLLMIVAASDPNDQLAAARNRARHIQNFAYQQGITPPLMPKRAFPTRHDGRIRVGYLSPDFRDHVVGSSIVELLERHDRKRIELIGIQYGGHDHSTIRARCESSCDRFYDWTSEVDAVMAEKIAALELDVLVDLAGYSQAKQEMLVSRPAALQVNYLGYAGSSGAPWIDYLLADSYVVPESERPHYSESIVSLPECFFPADTTLRLGQQAVSRREEGLPEEGFVYACFNNHGRISPEVFEIWMRVLHTVDDSVLWLQSWHEKSKANLLLAATEAGIDPSRLIFAQRIEPRSRHLERHVLADLFLDTFPYNMHTTARDALWAGVPMLTCSGRTFASRVGGSLLSALGLQELITTNAKDYEAEAIRWGESRSDLRLTRQKLAQARRSQSLFDMSRLARHIEDAYQAMVDRHRQGLQPDHLTIAARPRTVLANSDDKSS